MTYVYVLDLCFKSLKATRFWRFSFVGWSLDLFDLALKNQKWDNPPKDHEAEQDSYAFPVADSKAFKL